MTTRRIISSEKTILDKDDVTSSRGGSGKSDISPAVPAYVVYKLLGFTFAMITAPIGMYFLTVNMVFAGNSVWAGATAAVTANVVLVGYVIAAMKEDQGERAEESRKSQ